MTDDPKGSDAFTPPVGPIRHRTRAVPMGAPSASIRALNRLTLPPTGIDPRRKLKAAIALMKTVRVIDRTDTAKTLGGGDGQDIPARTDVLLRVCFWMAIGTVCSIDDALKHAPEEATGRLRDRRAAIGAARKFLMQHPDTVAAFVPDFVPTHRGPTLPPLPSQQAR